MSREDKQRCRKVFLPCEDAVLFQVMRANPGISWKNVAFYLPGRTARQCRDRWVNYLNPDITFRSWTERDDEILQEKFAEYGPKWSKILNHFPNRSYNDLKNRFYTKFVKMISNSDDLTSQPATNISFPLFDLCNEVIDFSVEWRSA